MVVVSIGALNDHPLGLDVKLREFLLAVGCVIARAVVVVAGIDADFDLGVETGINVWSGIETG